MEGPKGPGVGESQCAIDVFLVMNRSFLEKYIENQNIFMNKICL